MHSPKKGKKKSKMGKFIKRKRTVFSLRVGIILVGLVIEYS